jgi:hypothetical protein
MVLLPNRVGLREIVVCAASLFLHESTPAIMLAIAWRGRELLMEQPYIISYPLRVLQLDLLRVKWKLDSYSAQTVEGHMLSSTQHKLVLSFKAIHLLKLNTYLVSPWEFEA